MYRNFESMNLDGKWYSFVKQSNFTQLAIEIFHFQYQNNDIYRQYCQLIGTDCSKINTIQDIPFLPIHFFKTHEVTATSFEPEVIFESSGTTQMTTSKHFVKSTAIYLDTCISGFEETFGIIDQTPILCLLPSYLERNNSSLVFMAQHLINKSNHPDSGFYLYNFTELAETLQKLEAKQQKYYLLGVTFALLDFADANNIKLTHATVIETGGMKGRKEEWTRNQVHEYLKSKFSIDKIYSEYGMTELLSQAYLQTDEIFKPIASLRAFIRDINDPLSCFSSGKGALNIIDLSNIYSCSFIATEDIGHVFDDNRFEVLGRLDLSALRGCSLMAI